MELDKRIVEGRKYLDIFDTKEAQEYIGQKCYFSDKIARFSDLDDPKLVKATLTHVKAEDCEYCYGSNEIGLADWYYARYILPLAWVKEPEKKYRPYTLAEWIDQHEIGEVIHYRSKLGETETRHMYVGTRHSQGIKQTILKITLGDVSHTLDYLFENYEIEVDGEWKPFGVKVKDGE